MKLGMAHPMGPLTLADFIGLDVCVNILNVLKDGLGDDKYRACPLLRRMVAAGHLGRRPAAASTSTSDAPQPRASRDRHDRLQELRDRSDRTSFDAQRQLEVPRVRRVTSPTPSSRRTPARWDRELTTSRARRSQKAAELGFLEMNVPTRSTAATISATSRAA
jgi:3-hydroxyacyl-CoA dehydrogenase